jgi:hypothetical protein
MDPRWRTSYTTFIEDVGQRPRKGYTLGRLNPNKGYYKGNVQWMPHAELARHKRTNRILKYDGKKYVLAALGEEKGLPPKLLRNRLVAGLTVQEAVERPVENGNVYYFTYQGKTQSLVRWAEELDIPYATLRSRLRQGISLEKAFAKRDFRVR